MKKLLALALIAATASFTTVSAQAQDVKRAITKVAGDVYRFQNNFHFSLVTVTNDGVVVVDPINADAASWLKTNLSSITDKPITHLIYSHSHADHASGGAALGAANVIAQENAPDAIDGVKPTERFGESKSYEIGGKTFELTWLGKGHGDDLISVIVRPENVGFITDVAAPKRVPFKTMPSSSVDAWIDQVRKVDTLDFDIFAPAHGNVGVKADVKDVLAYMLELRAGVLAGLKAGKTAVELEKTLRFPAYKAWLQYEAWGPLNVRGMADYLVKAGKVN
ncbi:MAG: MBL fold metallo-hydrolase [Hyphomicrobiales bacterium]